jgi:putative ABC transport system ATP-binding protein
MIFLLLLVAFVTLWGLLNFLLNNWYEIFNANRSQNPEKALKEIKEPAPIEPPFPDPTSGNHSLEVSKLLKNYSLANEEIKAVDIPKLTVQKGEFLAIMGRSGSGKSTLLNLLGGLDRPTSGAVFLDGDNLASLKGSQLTDVRNKKIGFVFQEFNLIPTLTAQENVELPLRYSGLTKVERSKKALAALDSVGLKSRANHFPSQLSGGESQRVTIARALVNKPTVVLADEPTGEVDSQTSTQLVSLMKDLNKKLGTTFVIVTHDPIVAKATNRILSMQDGRIITDKNIVKLNSDILRVEDELV